MYQYGVVGLGLYVELVGVTSSAALSGVLLATSVGLNEARLSTLPHPANSIPINVARIPIAMIFPVFIFFTIYYLLLFFVSS